MTTAIDLIAAERQRQIEEEQFTAAHDAQHNRDGDLAEAAACYALAAYYRDMMNDTGSTEFWPWDSRWWKPSPNNRIRELVKAGALIAAEIDRLQQEQNHE